VPFLGHPGIVTQYRSDAMGAPGAVGCVDCHGDDHEAIFASGEACPLDLP